MFMYLCNAHISLAENLEQLNFYIKKFDQRC